MWKFRLLLLFFYLSASKIFFPTLLPVLHFSAHSEVRHWQDGLTPLCCQQQQRNCIFEEIYFFVISSSLTITSLQAIFLFGILWIYCPCQPWRLKRFGSLASNWTPSHAAALDIYHMYLPVWHIFIRRKLAAFAGRECIRQNLVWEPWNKNGSHSFTGKW